MAVQKMRRRYPLAVLSLQLAVVGRLSMITAQEPPTTAARGTVPTTAITIAIVAFFVLAVLSVLVNQWRGSSVDVGGGQQGSGSHRRRRRGLDPAALAALPILPYAEVKKHRAGGGELECAVCLTAFDDGEELRLLPQCFHAFHPDCIDPWLESHVTCPLCRADLEKPAPVVAPEAVAAAMDNEERKEEAVELERLRCARRAARCVRRAARMPRSNSTGHSPPSTAAAETTPGDYERFTVRLPPQVRAELLKSRRLRHSTSLVGRLRAQSCEESLACGGGSWHGAKRRWPFFLARPASSAPEEPV